MITATIADQLPPKLHLFRSYRSNRGPDEEDTLVWKAARASGAAPTYIQPEGNFVDGGIMCNNPSLALLTEVFNARLETEKPTALLSLGTGVPPIIQVRPYKASSYDFIVAQRVLRTQRELEHKFSVESKC